MNSILEVSREELKYYINSIEKRKLENDLDKLLISDVHNDIDGYKVRSLYFDSIDDTDFYDKVDGVENRKKIRLRIYTPNDTVAKLEIKRKFNNNQVKSSVIISRDDAIKLIDCNYDVLLKYDNNAAREIYYDMKLNLLKPKVTIEYERKAYVHSMNHIRVTLDSNIRSSESQFNIFSDSLTLIPIDINTTILEVKYDGYLLNSINDILKKYNITRTSYSKYTSSRSIFENYLS